MRRAIAIVASMLLLAGAGWSESQDCPNGQCPLPRGPAKPIGGSLDHYAPVPSAQPIVVVGEAWPEAPIVESVQIVSEPVRAVTYVEHHYPGRSVVRVGRGAVRVTARAGCAVARGAYRVGRGTVRVVTAPVRWACRRGRCR